jgi:hypothetical protein
MWQFQLPTGGLPRGRSSSPGRVNNFHLSTSSIPPLGSTQPIIQRLLGIKRQGREIDYSLPTSPEVKKVWTYTSSSHASSRRSA